MADLSGTFGIIIKTLSVPIILVALQPLKALDYTKASTYMQLANDDICSLPEFSGVAVRMGKKVPDMIIGTLYDDPQVDVQIDEYCRISRVLHDLKNAQFGHLGHPINAMLDMHTDATMLTSMFGCHVVECEANELVACYDRVTEEEIRSAEDMILDFFDTPDPVSDPISLKLQESDLRVAAKVSVALKHFVEEKKLHGLAYYYDGPEKSKLRTVMSNLIVGNSLLTSNGFPMCGESDLKTLIALLLMDRLGIGGSFAEFHPVDFKEGFVLVGHDGPHNISIAEGKPILRSLKKYHGKPGHGAGVEFKIKEGPITMLSINSTYDGKGHIVGKVSPMDLLMALEPRYSRLKINVGEYSRSHSYDKMIGSALDQAALWTTPLHELCTDASGILIRDFVSSPSAGQTVKVTDSLDKALHRFVMNRHDSLFVTDGGRLVGMLAFSDVYAHLSATMKDACAISPTLKNDLHGVP